MMISEWKDENDNWLRVVEDIGRVRVQVQLESKGEARTFWFDTPGDFGDFVAVMTDALKRVYDIDFAKILYAPKEQKTEEE